MPRDLDLARRVWPSARNDYEGSRGDWLHKHECGGSVEFAPNYRVCRCGRVWGAGKTRGRAYRAMRIKPGQGGYLWVQLQNPGRKRSVHRLVAIVFHGPPPFHGAQVRHLDGNPINNTAENLAWGTAKQNAEDRDAHGRTATGTVAGGCEDALVLRAMDLFATGKTQREVARACGVSQSTVWRWRHGLRRAALVAALVAAPVRR